MRHEHETAKSFNELKEITQIMQAQKRSEPTSANAKISKISEITHKPALKPKSSAQTKIGRLNPTKKAFSERQITAFRDNSQASDHKRLQTNQGKNSNLRAKPSNKAFKPGLATHQENQKGGKNEA
ncbi:hypothetical protein [Helicobacter pylori]|uniref:hypothetical protein n=1 Tax=Helicobacter pylori TaxID=210 RepID=UPI0018D1E9FE|nr:hypothetical protein [Helicobacter pylori]MBH0306267.1 hypothetical protein [Helicobacter pylori]